MTPLLSLSSLGLWWALGQTVFHLCGTLLATLTEGNLSSWRLQIFPHMTNTQEQNKWKHIGEGKENILAHFRKMTKARRPRRLQDNTNRLSRTGQSKGLRSEGCVGQNLEGT